MPDHHPPSTAPRRFAPAAIVALVATLVGAACVPMALAKTVEFSTATDTPAPLDMGYDAPQLGVQGTVKFTTSRADRTALKAHKQAEQLRIDADKRIAASTKASERIRAIDDALTQAQEDEARLAEIIRSRAVEQYKEGELGTLDFLLDTRNLSQLITRSQVVQDQADRDQRTYEEYEVTLTKIEVYRSVLEELRDINGDQAQRLQERAGRLDELLVASQVGHDEAPEGTPKKEKGLPGTWYVMDGAFQAQMFLPNAGSGYTGGTITAAQKATPAQIAAVLNDKRIDLDASGYQDVLTGQIDGRLLRALSLAANQFKYVKVTSLKSDHGTYTASGNVSEHSYGCAADIGTIGSTYITPSSQVAGSEVQDAVLFFMALQGNLAPHQVISLFNLGGASLSMSDHGDHIHLGYAC